MAGVRQMVGHAASRRSIFAALQRNAADEDSMHESLLWKNETSSSSAFGERPGSAARARAVLTPLASALGSLNDNVLGPLARSVWGAFGLPFDWLPAALRGPTPLLVTMDPGQDLDDEMFLVMLRALTARGLVQCRGVVATLAPSLLRARLARGTLDELGLPEVPVAAGTDGGATGDVDSMLGVGYMGGAAASSESGLQLMVRLLRAARRRELTLVITSSLKDAAELIVAEEALFVAKVGKVVVQGGCEDFVAGVSVSGPRAYLKPDTAHNNMFDLEAATVVYAACQRLGVPLVVTSRFSAYSCPVPRSIYDEMAATGSNIGQHLQQVQATSIEGLWKRACEPEGTALRAGLPLRCDRGWFCDTFCDGEGKSRTGDVAIWDLVCTFNMYDPLALLAAVPALEYMFDFSTLIVDGTLHRVAGVSKEKTGIRAGADLAPYMCAAFMEGIDASRRDEARPPSVKHRITM